MTSLLNAFVAPTCLVLGLGLRGQSTLTVGAGAQYQTLQAAVAAAQDGDLVLVQAGGYNLGFGGITTSKALTILGAPGAQLLGHFASNMLMISGLPAGKTFVLDGFNLVSSSSAHGTQALAVDNCQGVVHFANLTILGLCPQGGFNCDSPLLVQNSALVTWSHCTSSGLGIDCYSSRMMMVDCEFVGRSARQLPVSYGAAATQALLALSSQIWLTQTTLRGGPGEGNFPGAVALAALGGSMTIAGDGAAVIATGAPGATSSQQSAIHVALGVTLVVDSGVTLAPNAGQPPVAFLSAASVTMSRPVGLVTDGGIVGTTATFDIRCVSGETVFLVGGPGTAQQSATPFGPTWLDPIGPVVVTTGVQGPTEVFSHSIVVPNTASLRGAYYGFQALAGGSTAPWRWSALSPLVLR